MFKNNHIVMPEDHMDELYNSKNPLVKFAHTKRLKEIVKLLPHTESLKILDAGCGEGHLIQEMHNSHQKNSYYGADITPVALQKARERAPYARYELNDLAKLNFENNFFDVITCTEVIEHIYEYKNVLKELQRILKPGGFLILTFPNEVLWTISRFFLGRRPIKVPDHVNSFTPRRIRSATGLRAITQKNLPFSLPFFLSLNCAIKFQK